MSAKTCSKSPGLRSLRCRDISGAESPNESVAARHTGIIGFDQKIYSLSSVALIGAGGINGENGEGFVRKGIGKLDIFDGDDVELTNLNRQKFTEKDIGKNKAIRLANNLKREGYLGSVLNAYPYFFQEALEKGIIPKADLLVCGVDNDETRVFVARYAVKSNLPVIFSAVSRDANQGYVFIQEPDKACFACAFPGSMTEGRKPCPGVPAVKDILKIVSGLTLYAADTLLMSRVRDWNYRMVYLAGFVPDLRLRIERNPDCPVCTGAGSKNDAEAER